MSDGITSLAIKEIERLANAAHTAVIVDAPKSEPTGTYYILTPDGRAERQTAAPAWRNHRIETPAELRRYIESVESDAIAPAVFYSESGLQFVFEHGDDRHRAYCPLAQSPQYKYLTAAAAKGSPSMRQADLVRLLRIDFAGCVTNPQLLPLIRNLKWDTGATGSAVVQHGRESMARSVRAEVMGEDAIPEDVKLIVPVFENHPFKAAINVAIELNPSDQTFRLTPYPQEVKRAMDEALADIAALFEGEDMPPIYRGQP